MAIIAKKTMETVFKERLRTQRRIITLNKNDCLIIHPSFLNKMGIVGILKTDEIKFLTKSGDVKFSELDCLKKGKNNNVVVVDSKRKSHDLFSTNFDGTRSEINLAEFNIKHLTIDHNPSIAAIVLTKFYNKDIENAVSFSSNVLKNLGNKFNLSSKELPKNLQKVFDKLPTDKQKKIKKEYQGIIDEFKLEICEKNTSNINRDSIKYINNNL